MIRRQLPASGIRSIFDRAQALKKSGKEILQLDVGRPEWPLPPSALESIHSAVRDGFNHYVENRGLLELREQLSQRTFLHAGVRFSPETEMIVTVGGTEAVAMIGLALLGAGDEMILPLPAWNHYAAVAQMAGAEVRNLPLKLENQFQIDPDELKKLITNKTKLVVVNSPSNPTGMIQSEESLKEVARLSEKYGFYVLSDEVYDEFYYSENQPSSIGRFMRDSSKFIYLNSFSKTFAMTGWRLGWIASAPEVSDALNRVHQYLTVCASSHAQRAVSKMLKHEEIPAYHATARADFKLRRDVWMRSLAGLSSVVMPRAEGAFYLFPKIQYKNLSGREFCNFLLEEKGVSAVPGDVFGEMFSEHIRISYGGSFDTQERASKILREVLQ